MGKQSLPAPGFQPLGLPISMLRTLQKLGYNQPTPIQRKVIPILMSGENDVVASARTGSGKTLAFLVPLFIRLKEHSSKVGARAVVLSPTRELATQICSVFSSLVQKSNSSLRAITCTAGDSIPSQFSLLLQNPDVIIATPGRLLHLLQEADIHLDLDMLIIDEADRILEDPTLSSQLNSLLLRLNRKESSLTCLTSATLASIEDIRSVFSLRPDVQTVSLDSEQKLSPDLLLHFISASKDNRESILLGLLEKTLHENTITSLFPHSNPLKGVIFVATRHGAEWISAVLTTRNIQSYPLYGQMDAEARKIAMSNFCKGNGFLVVTDVAARGIDLPFLDFVVNFDFPPSPKLFVHRAGRVARAGRIGITISLVLSEERPYFVDLKASLGLNVVLNEIHQPILDMWMEWNSSFCGKDATLKALQRCHTNALRRYSATRSPASPVAFRNAKDIKTIKVGIDLKPLMEPISLLSDIKNWRPSVHAFKLSTISDERKKPSNSTSIFKPPQSVLPAVTLSKSFRLLPDEMIQKPTAMTRRTKTRGLGDGKATGELYSEWKKSVGVKLPLVGSQEHEKMENPQGKLDYRNRKKSKSSKLSKSGNSVSKPKSRSAAKSELRRPEQILRMRKLRANKETRSKRTKTR